MSRIQSSNITDLSEKLGFPPNGQEVDRDPKDFRQSTTEFRQRFAQQGHPLPLHAPYSPEAEQYALAFCQEDNRALTLWPRNDFGWPCWETDRTTSVLRDRQQGLYELMTL